MWHRNPKHVPTRIRNIVLQRDGHQCTAQKQDGTRCQETSHLEAHHLRGYHPAENTHPDHLTTLCHWHHNLITQQQAARAKKNTPPPRQTRPPVRHPGLR